MAAQYDWPTKGSPPVLGSLFATGGHWTAKHGPDCLIGWCPLWIWLNLEMSNQHPYIYIYYNYILYRIPYTLPETNIASKNMVSQKGRIVFQPFIFRVFGWFQGGYTPHSHLQLWDKPWHPSMDLIEEQSSSTAFCPLRWPVFRRGSPWCFACQEFSHQNSRCCFFFRLLICFLPPEKGECLAAIYFDPNVIWWMLLDIPLYPKKSDLFDWVSLRWINC